jgi:hypothetical protein
MPSTNKDGRDTLMAKEALRRAQRTGKAEEIKTCQAECEILDHCSLCHTALPASREQSFQRELVLAKAGDARVQQEVA